MGEHHSDAADNHPGGACSAERDLVVPDIVLVSTVSVNCVLQPEGHALVQLTIWT